MDVIDLLAEDREVISYRKSLNHITGGVLETVLLQQIIFNAKLKDWQPFYKFRSPCNHELYRKGDSWTEELGFTVYELDNAIKKIGTKITAGVKKSDVLNQMNPKSLVLYWTDANRVTWYQLNRELLGKLIKSNYLESGFCPITLESDKPELPITESLRDLPENQERKLQRPQVIASVQVFVQETGKYCLSQPQMREVDRVVGTEPIALDKWREVVKTWVMRGHKPTNAAGMLEWFNNGIPQYTNGHQAPPEPPKPKLTFVPFKRNPNDTAA